MFVSNVIAYRPGCGVAVSVHWVRATMKPCTRRSKLRLMSALRAVGTAASAGDGGETRTDPTVIVDTRRVRQSAIVAARRLSDLIGLQC